MDPHECNLPNKNVPVVGIIPVLHGTRIHSAWTFTPHGKRVVPMKGFSPPCLSIPLSLSPL